jgi:hypothetical protein
MIDGAPLDALRAAIWETTPAEGWSHDDRSLRFDLVQGCLVRWTDDIERTVRKSRGALERAAASGATEEGADEIELSLLYAVAAREKLIALLAQFLGVPSLDPYKDGIRFFPRENRVRNELMNRAKEGLDEAGALLQSLIAFDELRAIGLRNQLEHGISFLPRVTEICWFRVVDLGFLTGEPVGGEMSNLMAEGVLEHGDISPDTLFDWAKRCAHEALDGFERLVKDTLGLVRSVGQLAPVNEVYRAPGLSGIHMTRPTPGNDAD